LKDTQASVIQIANGLKSRRAIIAEGGGDIVDTFQELEEDAKLADAAGLRVDAGNSPKPVEGDD
jgi:capsid protein